MVIRDTGRKARPTSPGRRTGIWGSAAALLSALWVMAPAPGLAAEDFTFDASEFETKPFELRGYVELEPNYAESNEDGALYELEFFDEEPRASIFRLPAVLELEGRYRKGISTLSFRSHTTKTWDYTDDKGETVLYEGLLTLQPDPGFSFDIGKKAYRWGTGYAWNPIAFVERPRMPATPISRARASGPRASTGSRPSTAR